MKFYTNLNQLLLFLICSTFYSCKSDESIDNEAELAELLSADAYKTLIGA